MSEPDILLGAENGFGTFAGWNLKSDKPKTSPERLRATDSTGNEVKSKLVNEKTEFESEYECESDTNTVPSSIGDVYGSRILTSIKITTNNKGAATMSLSGHQHAVNPHLTGVRAVAHGITVAKCFGAIDFMGGTGTAGSAVESGSIEIKCEHLDKEDADGDHLVGNNFDPMMIAETKWTGPVTTPAGAGWDVTDNSVPNAATEYESTELSGTKALTFGTVTPP